MRMPTSMGRIMSMAKMEKIVEIIFLYVSSVGHQDFK